MVKGHNNYKPCSHETITLLKKKTKIQQIITGDFNTVIK